MKAQQVKIEIAKGVIKSVSETPGYVSLINKKESINIKDVWLYPGFVDAHGHIVALGQMISSLNLSDCNTALECVVKAKNFKGRRGQWLVGRAWNHENWNTKEYPTKKILDASFPDTPVSLTRVDGHTVWVNSFALRLAGIDKNTTAPPGGAIMRDANSEPTGILIDNAMSLISDLLPPRSEKAIEQYIVDANKKLLSAGITEVHDMDVSPAYIPIYKRLDEAGKLNVRIQAFVQAQNDEWLKNEIKPYIGNMFNVIGVKFYADGALGSHGAAMLEPYSDLPTSKGLLLISEDELYGKAAAAIDKGFHIATHAIGDAANHLVLNVYERLRNDGIASNDAILRIEHTQILKQSDILRLAESRIYASMQAVHCLSDAEMAQKRIGNRVRNSYLWKSLMSVGTIVAGGSDFPIESHNPLIGIDAFIHRTPIGKSEAWLSKERILPEQAIDAYTVNAHILSDNAERRGSIQKGLSADFTILNKDIGKLSHSDFASVEVLATIINGKIAYLNDKYIPR